MSNFGAAIYITIYGLHCHRPLLPHGPCHTPITPSIESHTPINIWPLFKKNIRNHTVKIYELLIFIDYEPVLLPRVGGILVDDAYIPMCIP